MYSFLPLRLNNYSYFCLITSIKKKNEDDMNEKKHVITTYCYAEANLK